MALHEQRVSDYTRGIGEFEKYSQDGAAVEQYLMEVKMRYISAWYQNHILLARNAARGLACRQALEQSKYRHSRVGSRLNVIGIHSGISPF